MHYTSVFEIIVLNSHDHYVLMCAFPFVHPILDCQAVSQWLLSEKRTLNVSLRLSTTSLPWTGALIPKSIILLKACINMENKYNSVSHI